jgi:hypothetical protein
MLYCITFSRVIVNSPLKKEKPTDFCGIAKNPHVRPLACVYTLSLDYFFELYFIQFIICYKYKYKYVDR